MTLLDQLIKIAIILFLPVFLIIPKSAYPGMTIDAPMLKSHVAIAAHPQIKECHLDWQQLNLND